MRSLRLVACSASACGPPLLVLQRRGRACALILRFCYQELRSARAPRRAPWRRRGAGRAPAPSRHGATDSCWRSAASLSAASRRSGTTAPRRMALRTEASASSGRTRIAGGGRWPMRWRAASTSARRRGARAARRRTFLVLRRAPRRRSVPAIWVSSSWTRLLVSSSVWLRVVAILVERVDLRAKLGLALLREGDVAGRPRRVRPAGRRARPPSRHLGMDGDGAARSAAGQPDHHPSLRELAKRRRDPMRTIVGDQTRRAGLTICQPKPPPRDLSGRLRRNRGSGKADARSARSRQSR